MTWRDRLFRRRDDLERWEREDRLSLKEGFESPGSKHLADSTRPELAAELAELRLICELLADASECFQ